MGLTPHYSQQSNNFSFLNKKYLIIFLLCSFLGLSLCATAFFKHPSRTLSPRFTDHFSHWGSAILFSKKGFDIYRKPSSELCRHGIPPDIALNINDNCSLDDMPAVEHGKLLRSFQINWQQFPRAYPPGDVLYHAVIGFLYAKGLVDFSTANWITIELYLLTAHLVFGLFTLLLLDPALTGSSKITQKALKFFIFSLLVLAYLLLMKWSLNGFYDPISIFFLLFSVLYYRQQKPTAALLFFSIGLFLHFRALWACPLLVFIFRDFYQKRSAIFTTRNIIIIILSVGLIVISLYTLTIQLAQLSAYDVNNSIFFNSEHHFTSISLRLVPLLAMILVLLKARLYLLASLSAWQLYMLTQMPSVQPWYNLFLLVFLAVAGTEPKSKTIALLTIFTFFLIESFGIFRN